MNQEPADSGHLKCPRCDHAWLHHVFPGCDFRNQRKVEFAPGLWIVVNTCGCVGPEGELLDK